jgi:hypothetical protein
LAQTFQTRAAPPGECCPCGDTNSLKVAIRCLHDPEMLVRTAVGSLAEWPHIAGNRLRHSQIPREPRYRLIAMRGLVRLASEQNAKPTPADRTLS